MTKILFDRIHGSWEYRSIISVLKDDGFEVELLYGDTITSEALNSCNILVIGVPKREFSNDEVNSIHKFVDNGGGLLVIGERVTSCFLNKITCKFGIEFATDCVCDMEHNNEHHSCPIIKNRLKHEIMEYVDEFTIFCGCSLTVKEPAEKVALGNETTWADQDRWKDKFRWVKKRYLVPDENEPKGDEVCLIAASEYGKGRVLCIGDSTLFMEMYMFHTDNLQMGVNFIYWLSKKRPIKKIDKERIAKKVTGAGPLELKKSVKPSSGFIKKIKNREITIKDIYERYTTGVLCAPPEAPLEEVLGLLEWNQQNKVVFILDKDKNVVGYISLKEILEVTKAHIQSPEHLNERMLRFRDAKVASDIMNTDFETLYKGSSIYDAIRIMEQYAIPEVPVVNDDGKLIGSLTDDELMDIIYGDKAIANK